MFIPRDRRTHCCLGLVLASLLAVMWLAGTASADSILVGQEAECILRDEAIQCQGDQPDLGPRVPFFYGGDSFSRLALRTPSGSGATALVSLGSFPAPGVSCVVDNGSAQCWVKGLPTRTLPGLESGVESFSVSEAITGWNWCAVRSGGIICALRDTTLAGRGGKPGTVNQVVPEGSSATAVTVLNDQACGLIGGSLDCWALRDDPQLAGPRHFATNSPQRIPTAVSDLTILSQDCAADSSHIYCGIINVLAEGNPNRLASVPVPAGRSVTEVSGRPLHHCAAIGGAAYCWGRAFPGAAWDNSIGASSTPRLVANVHSGVTSVSRDDDTACALVRGTAKCWGFNNGRFRPASLLRGPNAFYCNDRRSSQINGLLHLSRASATFRCAVSGKGVVPLKFSVYNQKSQTYTRFGVVGTMRWRVGSGFRQKTFSIRVPARARSLLHRLEQPFGIASIDCWSRSVNWRPQCPHLRIRP